MRLGNRTPDYAFALFSAVLELTSDIALVQKTLLKKMVIKREVTIKERGKTLHYTILLATSIS